MGGGTTNNPFVATFKDQPPIGGDLTKNPFTSSFIPPPGKKKIFPNKCPRPANFKHTNISKTEIIGQGKFSCHSVEGKF